MALPRPLLLASVVPVVGAGRALWSLGLTGYDLPCMMAETFTPMLRIRTRPSENSGFPIRLHTYGRPGDRTPLGICE
jgi:hypothetical protein